MCEGKRVSSDFFCNFETLDFQKALWLLDLPKLLATHPDGGEIILNIGRFSPYLRHNLTFFSLKQKEDALMEFSLEAALERIQQKKVLTKPRSFAVKTKKISQNKSKLELPSSRKKAASRDSSSEKSTVPSRKSSASPGALSSRKSAASPGALSSRKTRPSSKTETSSEKKTLSRSLRAKPENSGMKVRGKPRKEGIPVPSSQRIS